MRVPAPPSLTAGQLLFVLDALCGAVAWSITVRLAIPPMVGEEQPTQAALWLYPVAWLLFLFALGLYRREALAGTRKAMSRAPLAAILGGLAASVALLALPSPFALRLLPATLCFVAATLCFTLCGSAARAILYLLRQRGALHRRILIIGAGLRAWDLHWLLRKEGRSVVYDVVFVQGPDMGPPDPRLVAEHGNRVIMAEQGFLAIAQAFAADQIVVAPDERRGLAMRELLACRTAGFPVMEYLQFLENEIGRIDIKRLELGWLLYAEGFTFGLATRSLKRLLDIAVSAILLLLTSPFILATAIAVKLDDLGPVLYRQSRVTLGGRSFEILKVRTMRTDAERAGAVWAAERDPRITRIGRFLRRTRLDELPQLINVLRGDMSFVGPRPERPEFIRELAEKLPLYDERHLVKAGLTGWAQVNYPYGASLDDARSKLSYDLYYVKNSGLLFDVMIILQTLRVVLWPGGVR